MFNVQCSTVFINDIIIFEGYVIINTIVFMIVTTSVIETPPYKVLPEVAVGSVPQIVAQTRHLHQSCVLLCSKYVFEYLSIAEYQRYAEI